MQDKMHGARAGHECADVYLDHMLDIELASMKKQYCAEISIDCSRFFDSLEREVGNELVMEILGEDSSVHAKGYFEAEERLLSDSRFRFKANRAVEFTSQGRTNGFPQGPSSSIQKALAFMAGWTIVIKRKTTCKTAGFIDDTSIRANEATRQDTVQQLNFALLLSRTF